MRVVIAGGRSRTDFLVESLVDGGNEVVVINGDRTWCEHMSSRHGVPVVCVDDADIEGSDLIIALSDSDADNLVICQMAQRYFDIERQVCTVSDPRNVVVFKKLGISSVISATYTVARLIEEASFGVMGNDAHGIA